MKWCKGTFREKRSERECMCENEKVSIQVMCPCGFVRVLKGHLATRFRRTEDPWIMNT